MSVLVLAENVLRPALVEKLVLRQALLQVLGIVDLFAPLDNFLKGCRAQGGDPMSHGMTEGTDVDAAENVKM